MMNKFLVGGLFSLFVIAITGCGARFAPGENVAPGQAGLLMELYGQGRGVKNAKLIEGGKVIVGPGQDLMIYPTSYFVANFTKDLNEGAPIDQRIRFSSSGGGTVGLDTSVSFSWAIDQVPGKPTGYTRLHEFVAKYNVEPREFINGPLFAATRDCATKSAADKGLGAAAILANVQPLLEGMTSCLQAKFPELNITGVGSLATVEVDPTIRDVINAQFAAQQGAVTARADAEKAKADGEALLAVTRAKAEAAIEEARGKAEADRLRSASTTPQLIELKRLEVQLREVDKWNGVRPSTIIQSGSVQVPPSQQ